jgi:GNAT superfamily N-acetyltransferase
MRRKRQLTENPSRLVPSDCPPSGTFEAIYQALDASSRPLIGTAEPRLLVIAIQDDNGSVRGGLWGWTRFEWLHIQMLFVPEPLRDQGVGSALMASAEAEARRRGCRGALVDAFSFQAPRFYETIGFTRFGVLQDFPPGHNRHYFFKRINHS